MKTIIHKSALSTALVASGLAMHVGAALAAGANSFDANIAVTSAACVIKTGVDDSTPFAATADFNSTQVASNLKPTMSVSGGTKSVSVESNCPLVGITMVPSATTMFGGSTKAKDVAVAKTSDGQWPMDFFWSKFEVYTDANTAPDDSVNVRLGNGGYFSDLTYDKADAPIYSQGDTGDWAAMPEGGLDDSGNPIQGYFTAPLYHYQATKNESPTSFTTNTQYNAKSYGRTNAVLAVQSLSSGNKKKFVAYIGAMFGTQPYGNDGLPMAGAVADSEIVTLSRTLTVTAS